MVLIIGDSILWNSKTRSLTPIEVMTSFEGDYADIVNVVYSHITQQLIRLSAESIIFYYTKCMLFIVDSVNDS